MDCSLNLDGGANLCSVFHKFHHFYNARNLGIEFKHYYIMQRTVENRSCCRQCCYSVTLQDSKILIKHSLSKVVPRIGILRSLNAYMPKIVHKCLSYELTQIFDLLYFIFLLHNCNECRQV
jgi:hypothetical protein